MPSYIELNDFLKINNVAATGGKVKIIIRSGIVKVNGEIETRNRKKLVPGDKVQIEERVFTVGPEVVREHS
ncbi:RNA-binding protein [Candidatus Woesearchaeota archaeon CG10_big_fil_rev_8_21_14_0_10_45_16]|nr:MAG: RNA-binding protein [Candidatus Woesearchaeota archaeon CG10_big_fil_rev_8_21_14_0_10_45_16]